MLARQLHLAAETAFTAANITVSVDGDDSNDAASSSAAAAAAASFNPAVFWSVNAFLLCMLLATCWSCRYGKKYLMIITRHSIDHNARHNSDLAFLRHQLAREAARAEQNTESPEQRKQNVLDSFRRCQVTMVVRPEDIVDSVEATSPTPVSSPVVATATETETETDENVIVVETGNPQNANVDANAAAAAADNDVETATHLDVEDDGCDAGYLVLRSGGKSQQQPRKVPNGCAICLGPYEVGETVVWSSNAACQHAFHQDCMVDWLCKMKVLTTQSHRHPSQQDRADSSTSTPCPCPCCRQEFTDLETYRKEKRIVAPPRDTFNLQLIRL
jgi:hypothetical protein